MATTCVSRDACRLRTEKMRTTLVQPLQAIFSCNLSAVDRRVFTRGFMRQKWTINTSFSLQSFRTCNRRGRLKTLPGCIEPLIKKCLHSNIIAVKVIRLHMSYVDQLLSDDPDLRLIHLVRDPRGLVEAWRKVAIGRRSRSVTQMQMNAKLICQRMLTDCQIRRQLELKYPRRILVLRYEDLVTATDSVLNNVYDRLLQLQLPSNLSDVIKQQLHATSANGPTGTLRINGAATATKWRRTVSNELQDYIRDTCHQLLDELHYNLIK